MQKPLPFYVIGTFKEDTSTWANQTKHFNKDLKIRVDNLSKNAKLVKSFIVDKQHKKGKEVHSVYSTGEIFIYNLETKKIITILFARPNQIIRLFAGVGEKTPPQLIQQALKNCQQRKNLI